MVTSRPGTPHRIGLGDVIDLTLRTLRRYPLPLLALYALFDAPLTLVGAVAGSGFIGELERATAIDATGVASISTDEVAVLLPLLVPMLVVAFASGVVATIGTGAVALAMRDASEGRAPRVGASFAGAVRRAPALVGGALLALLVVVVIVVILGATFVALGAASGDRLLVAGGGPATFLALVALVAGVVITVTLQVRWAFVAQAVVLDRVGPLAALRVSWSVTRGATWRVFGMLLVLVFAVSVLVSLVQELGNVLMPAVAGGRASATGPGAIAVGAVASVVFGVVLPIATTIIYLDLRLRRATAGGSAQPPAG